MPNKRKKMGKEKQRSREERKQKGKRRGGRETLLSVHARISKAVIWHQE